MWASQDHRHGSTMSFYQAVFLIGYSFHKLSPCAISAPFDWVELLVVRQGATVITGKKLPEELRMYNVIAILQPLDHSRITIVQWSPVALRMTIAKDQASQSSKTLCRLVLHLGLASEIRYRPEDFFAPLCPIYFLGGQDEKIISWAIFDIPVDPRFFLEP
jgi:hypothetical protein